MNLKQRQTVLATAKNGCQVCAKPASMMVIWTFVNTSKNESEHAILALIRCDEHAEQAREQQPQVPANIRVDITEETLKPLVFLS